MTMSEQSWENKTREELLAELKKMKAQADIERRRADGLAEELRISREQNINMQKQVEQEEEYITNKLMKRLEQLKKEKAVLASEVQQEEELIANTLQKRLEKLTKEKVDLENRLEAEQEYIVNKLRKQLEQLNAEKNRLLREKIDLENQLEAEQEYIVNKLQKQVEKLGTEKKSLQKEKSDLQRTVSDLDNSVARLNREKVKLEQQMEAEEENIVNRLQRQLEHVLSNFRSLEQKLEARGFNLKDLGVNASDLGAELTQAYSRSSSVSSSFDKQLSSALRDHHMMSTSPGAVPVSGFRRERPLSATSSSAIHDLLGPLAAK